MPRTKRTVVTDEQRKMQDTRSRVTTNASSFGTKWAVDAYGGALTAVFNVYAQDPTDENATNLHDAMRDYQYAHMLHYGENTNEAHAVTQDE